MSGPASIKANCACGAVSLSLRAKPDFVNDCNCTLCRSTGALWGYFETADLEVLGLTSTYHRRDRKIPGVAIHFCDLCGTVTHWTLTEAFLKSNGPVDRLGVNMRLFETDDLEGVEVRFPDGRAWDGKSDYGYRRQPLVIGEDAF